MYSSLHNQHMIKVTHRSFNTFAVNMKLPLIFLPASCSSSAPLTPCTDSHTLLSTPPSSPAESTWRGGSVGGSCTQGLTTSDEERRNKLLTQTQHMFTGKDSPECQYDSLCSTLPAAQTGPAHWVCWGPVCTLHTFWPPLHLGHTAAAVWCVLAQVCQSPCSLGSDAVPQETAWGGQSRWLRKGKKSTKM